MAKTTRSVGGSTNCVKNWPPAEHGRTGLSASATAGRAEFGSTASQCWPRPAPPPNLLATLPRRRRRRHPRGVQPPWRTGLQAEGAAFDEDEHADADEDGGQQDMSRATEGAGDDGPGGEV